MRHHVDGWKLNLYHLATSALNHQEPSFPSSVIDMLSCKYSCFLDFSYFITCYGTFPLSALLSKIMYDVILDQKFLHSKCGLSKKTNNLKYASVILFMVMNKILYKIMHQSYYNNSVQKEAKMLLHLSS